jgi:protein involved in polysaccharide export with SLBB domain
MKSTAPLTLAALLPLTLAAQDAADSPANEPKSSGSSTNSAKSSQALVDAETRDFKARDVFRYSILEDPTPGNEAGSAMVSDGGEVRFKVSGNYNTYISINVREKKLADIRREFKRLLDEKFYTDATVSVDFDAAGGQQAAESASKVVVYGAMSGSFRIPETEDLYLSDVFTQMGRNDYANLKKVKVYRKAGGTITINVDEILRTGNRDKDIKLSDGDRIQVPDRSIIF